MSLDYLGYELKELKATDDSSGGGVFSGYASTWEKDLYDDVIVKGAFEQTLSADFKAGGAGIPIHWQHKDGSPNDVIGETLSAVEDEHGLLITAKLDTDIAEGKRAYDLLKRGLIHQMSIGFIAEKSAWVESEALLENARALAPLYRELAERCGAFFCDTAAWDIPVVFDGVHFSEDGHRRFAKQMQRVLDTVFR